MTPFAAVVLAATLGGTPPHAATSDAPEFEGEKTTWHGFDRYDFLMDETALTIKPHKTGADEGNAVETPVKGHFRCVVVVPKVPAAGNPWSWQGYYWDHEPQTEVELLNRGFHVGFIWCDAGKPWDAWYMYLTETHGLSKKPAFIGMSRGGREAYTWAIENADRVSCLYVDNPAVSREAVAKLGDLAKADMPVLHMCGSIDPILSHTQLVEAAYQQLGGRATVIVEEGKGHFPTAPRDPKPVVDFIVGRQPNVPAAKQPSAAKPRDYTFDKTLSRPVLENYLARAISVEGILNGRGDLDDNVRMLKDTGAKFIGRAICLWGGEASLLKNLERAKEQMPKLHKADPDLVVQACVFEIVTTQVEQVPVPEWAFKALGQPVEKRNFKYADMLYPDGKRKDHWRAGQSVPDVSRPETKLWFYFLAASYIDVGVEAIHFGQTELMNGNDKDLKHYAEILALIRSYAAKNARRHLLICDSHVPSGGWCGTGSC
jgi:pimeloyl-ACP methyl ester carboxylesterase